MQGSQAMLTSIQSQGFRLALPASSKGSDPRLSIALDNLERAGWSFTLNRANDFSSGQPASGAEVEAFLARPNRQLDRSMGDRLVASRAGGGYFKLVRADEVAALDFFHGTGSTEGLEFPDLARKVRELESGGVKVQPGGGSDVPGHDGYSGYLALSRGGSANLMLGRYTLVNVNTTDPAELDAKLAPYAENLEHYRRVLLPEARAERLQEFMLGEVARSLRPPVQGLTLEERGQHFLQLAEDVRQGPDGKTWLADRTGRALKLYEHLVKAAPCDFAGAVARLGRVTRVVGAEQALKVSSYLLDELPHKSFYAEARQEREDTLLALLAQSLPVEVAVRLTERLALCPLGETPERRREVFLDLVKLHPAQAEVHLDNILTFHRPGADLGQGAAAYRMLLEGLVTMGRPQDASDAYRFLQEGLRLGRLSGTLEELIAGYLSNLLVSGDPAQARAAMAGDGGQGVPVVRQENGAVQVGGIRVPVRRKS